MEIKFQIDEIISIRRLLHQNAEKSSEEFKTTNIIIDFLKQKGIDNIKRDLNTGVIFDVYGKGEQYKDDKIIALRADIDALDIKEEKNLSYNSQTNCAHLCGHDGHTASLLGGLCLLLDNLEKIPKNRCVRFIFQPEEETIEGAKKMIEKGCLENVNEVWGYHNVPWDPIDKVFVKPETMMYGANQMFIKITGKGGHSSMKNELINPFYVASYMIVKIEEYHSKLSEQDKDKLIPVYPYIKTDSQATNIIPDEVIFGGVVRFADQQLYKDFMKFLENLFEEVKMKFGVQLSDFIQRYTNQVFNDDDLVKKLSNVVEIKSENLPIKASEDFSYYGEKVKSCFFFYSIGKKSGTCLHSNDYNFNDDCLENISKLWLEIIQNRLNEQQIQKIQFLIFV